MKALALVTHNKDKQIKWLFDRILAMIVYDVEIYVVFVNDGCHQLVENKIWKALPVYGVDELFDYNATIKRENSLITSKSLSTQELKNMIAQADIIL